MLLRVQIKRANFNNGPHFCICHKIGNEEGREHLNFHKTASHDEQVSWFVGDSGAR